MTSKIAKLVFFITTLFIINLQSATAVEEKGLSAEEILGKLEKNAAAITSIEAKFVSTNAACVKQEGVLFRFKAPGRFRLDIPEWPPQPELSLIIDGDRIFSWMPKQNLLNEGAGQAVLHPALIFAFDPGQIRSCAEEVKLRNPLPKEKEYILDLTVKGNSVIAKTSFSRMTIYVSSESHSITRVEAVDIQGQTSVCTPVKYYRAEKLPEIPVSWRISVPGDIFYSESMLMDVKVNVELTDDIFKPALPKETLVAEATLGNEEDYRAAIKANPDDASAHYNYGMFFAQRNDHKAAIEQFEKVSALRPELLMPKLMLAQAHISAKSPDKALPILDSILDNTGLTPAIRIQLTGVYQYAGQKEKAIEQVRKVIEGYPGDSVGYEQAIYLLQDKPNECKKLIEQYVKSAPKDIGTKFNEARFYSMLGLGEQAKRTADLILADPNINGWIAYQLANMMWNIKDYGRTEKFYEKVIELEPKFIPAYKTLADYYGRLTQSKKQEELAAKLAASNNQNVAALNTAASIYDMAGQTDEAVKTLEQVLEIAPFSQETYYNLSQLYKKIKAGDKLKELTVSLMKNCPPDGKTMFTAGAIYEEMKDIENAAVNYKKAVLQGNIDTFQYQRMLNFYLTNNLKADAGNLAGAIIKTSKDSQQIFLAASVLQELGKPEEALSAAKAALPFARIPSDTWMVQLFIAQLSYQQDKKDDAAKILKELVEQEGYAPNPEVFRNAQMMLSQILQEKGVTGEDLDKYLDNLIERMRQPGLSDQEIQDIAAGMVKNGKASAAKLLKLINDKDFQVQRLSIQILGDIGDASVAQDLRLLLDDTNPRVVMEAVTALGKIKDAGAVDKLIALLKDHKETAVRGTSAAALGKIGDKKAVEPLIKALSDTDKQILYFITQSLAELGDKKAIEPLMKVLKTEKSVTVKTWGAEALARFGVDDGYKFLADTTQTGSEPEIRDAILSIANIPGEKSFGMLKDCFKDKNVLVRKYAAFAAHQKTDADVLPLLIEALNDKEGAVRYGAAMSLGGIGKKEAIEPLEKAREKEDDKDIIDMIDSSLEMLKSVK